MTPSDLWVADLVVLAARDRTAWGDRTSMQLSATSELERAIRSDVAALAGDFEALVRLYRPKVFRFALA